MIPPKVCLPIVDFIDEKLIELDLFAAKTEETDTATPNLDRVDSPSTEDTLPSLMSKKRQRRASGANQNWFARFFHVKPATRVIAFNIPKIKSRKEVYKTLRDWKKYGMEDVHLDKAENIIYGRVAEGNCEPYHHPISEIPTTDTNLQFSISALCISLSSSTPSLNTADMPISASFDSARSKVQRHPSTKW
jgi:hypothetical protein